MKIYIVRLSDEECSKLRKMIASGRRPARLFIRARILLKADQSDKGPGWSDEKISEALDITVQTVERVRKQLVEEGFNAVLTRREYKQKVSRKKIDGEVEARIIALSCSEPPVGRARWTLRLLADKIVKLRYLESISDEAIRQTLKKELKPWLKQMWCIPPKANDAFVCAMEDIFEVYKRPYNVDGPLVCMDETTKQLTREIRHAIPGEADRAARIDYEHERNDVCNLFMFYEPFGGKRYTAVTECRTKVDWAYQIKELLDNHYPDVSKVVLVMDNLNTHTGASLYEAFEPAEARRLSNRLETHYTPKHGSWLNIAEIEPRVLIGQCLNRRIPDKQTLEYKVGQWQKQRNFLKAKVDWRFSTDDARIKLKGFYPTLLT